jgi:hypothetical protein
VRMSDKLRDRLAPSSVPSANFIRSTGMLDWDEVRVSFRDGEASVKTSV